MPSGSKKRKAAKKKKENHSHNAPNPSSASTRSHDDAKHQDDKDGDAGEVSSPASQDHRNHQNVLTEGEEEETKNEGSVVKIEREFKIKGKSIEKDGKIEQDASRKSYDGDSSRSSSSNSSSSSDDESHGIKNNSPAVKDHSPIVDSVKAADLLSETNVLVVETPMVDEISEVNENEEQNESSTEGKVGISDPKECEVQENDDRLTPSYSASNVPVNNGAESGKDSVTQPLLERPVQTTSWKSCCGLCELFTGSAR